LVQCGYYNAVVVTTPVSSASEMRQTAADLRTKVLELQRLLPVLAPAWLAIASKAFEAQGHLLQPSIVEGFIEGRDGVDPTSWVQWARSYGDVLQVIRAAAEVSRAVSAATPQLEARSEAAAS